MLARTWVVYRMMLKGNAVGGNVMCSKREWDMIEAYNPGYHILLHSGLKTEQEAEKLARGTAGDKPPRKLNGKIKDTPPRTHNNPGQVG
jgi:hypothetical protein